MMKGKFVWKSLILLALLAAPALAQQNAKISARHAASIKTAQGDTAIRLIGAPTVRIGGDVLSLNDGAMYYPDRNLIAASFVKSDLRLMSEPTISCNGNRVRVVYSNGTEIEADQMCLAGTSYTCKNGAMSQEADSPACGPE